MTKWIILFYMNVLTYSNSWFKATSAHLHKWNRKLACGWNYDESITLKNLFVAQQPGLSFEFEYVGMSYHGPRRNAAFAINHCTWAMTTHKHLLYEFNKERSIARFEINSKHKYSETCNKSKFTIAGDKPHIYGNAFSH